MQFLKKLLFISTLVFLANLAASQETQSTTQSTTEVPVTTPEPTTVSTKETTLDTTTAAPETTTPEITTKSMIPTTRSTSLLTDSTTAKVPETTTVIPETTTSGPETTTIVPETTTSGPETTTTTTISPSPKPVVPIYGVKDDDGKYCIMVQSITTLIINYYSKEKGNPSTSETFDLKMETITPTGVCTANQTYMNLEWVPKNGTKVWSLNITFAKIPKPLVDNDPDTYGVTKVELKYDLEETLFPNTNSTGLVSVAASGNFFKAKIGNYYTCTAKESINLKGLEKETSGVLMQTTDTKVEAFSTSESKEKFVGSAEPCNADSSASNLVPILVGVGLAIMILIALVVFLIGSRRRAAAYESL